MGPKCDSCGETRENNSCYIEFREYLAKRSDWEVLLALGLGASGVSEVTKLKKMIEPLLLWQQEDQESASGSCEA